MAERKNQGVWMKKSSSVRRLLAIWAVAALALPIAYGSASSSSFETTEKAGFEEAAVIEVKLADRNEVDRLVETGTDLTHEIHVHDTHIDAQVVVTPSEAADLRAQGFDLGRVLWTEADSRAVLAQRRDVIRENRQEARAFGIDATGYTEPVTKPATRQPEADELQSGGDQSFATASDTDNVLIVRADYFQSSQGHFISVEAKTDLAQTATLTLEWDEGPGTPIGSGGSINMQSFVDAGTYIYHRRQIGVDDRPEFVRVTSSGGGSDTRALEEWLPLPDEDPDEDPLLTGFVDHYMDATELMDRFEQLAAEFPEIAEVVELPNKTNGYRRKSQATLGSTGGGGPAAVVVESLDWGHEGGDDILVEFLNPEVASSPLSVSVVGETLVRVNLATDATGALTSTAVEVVAAINASGPASQIVRSFTYRGSAGGGTVQPAAATQLSDFLNAPDYVSHEPFTVKMLRIGKTRNGTRPGVLAYSQEHAREWQTPLVTTEFAERLLRNYAHNERIQKLVNQHEIFVAPSINPDGSHYSFHDFTSQRKTMTNHCPEVSGDPGRRNSWGVDTNRNYPTGSRFDGFSGASASCTSGTFSGPAELSEPENRNLVWIPQTFDNITHAMNIHSSGNYFMWSPGAYSLPGRILLPRPTLGEENYFWESSRRILTEIKEWRGTVVTPARTGPIADVLYSAAGNSGDHLWYEEDLYAWNFEVGTSFQPSWPEAGHQANEFANGLIELLEVTNDFSKDRKDPKSTVTPGGGNYAGPVEVTFSWDEPVSIYYTIDGGRPTFDSPTLESAGIREGAETLTITETTELKWFAIDAKGNIENNYDPDKTVQDKFNKETYRIQN
jgi:Zinc carboxypeptidase/Chitobiase/beta-hexosaminidase C-terminal domain